ncbi:hypothetical protein Tco_0649772 [Tanacetum coccineum]
MAGDDPITSVYTLGDGPNDPQPVVNLAGSDDPLTSIHNQSQPEPDLSDPVMHFVVQNFNQINAMYVALYTKRKEITSQQIFNQINAMYVASITESRKTKIVLLSEKNCKVEQEQLLRTCDSSRKNRRAVYQAVKKLIVHQLIIVYVTDSQKP